MFLFALNISSALLKSSCLCNGRTLRALFSFLFFFFFFFSFLFFFFRLLTILSGINNLAAWR